MATGEDSAAVGAETSLTGPQHWVRALRPRSPGSLPPAAAAPLRAKAAAVLGAAPVEWAVETAADLVEPTGRDLCDSAVASPGPDGAENELLRLLLHLAEDRSEPIGVSERALADARAAARRGVPGVVVVEAAWRLHVRVQEAMLSVGHGQEVHEDLTRLTRYTTRAVRDLLKAHAGAAGSADGHRLARRREVLARLALGGPATPEAEAVLGVRLAGQHLVALVVGADGGVVDVDDTRVEALARAVAEQLPGATYLAAPVPGATVVWWSASKPVTRGALDRLADLAVPASLAVAFGDLHDGPTGLLRGYGEASRVAEVARAGRRGRAVVHASALLAAALLADRPAAIELVRRELAGVLDPDNRSAELRRTVLAHLRAGGSRQVAAGQLGVAPTTVAYRVDRFDQVRGRRIEDSRLETWAALDLVDRAPALLAEAAAAVQR